MRRNLQSEIDEMTSDSEMVHTTRERLEQAFESDEVRLKRPPG